MDKRYRTAATIKHLTDIVRMDAENDSMNFDTLDACAIVNTWSATAGSIIPMIADKTDAYDTQAWDAEPVEVTWFDVDENEGDDASPMVKTILDWKSDNPSAVILCVHIWEELYGQGMTLSYIDENKLDERFTVELTDVLKANRSTYYQARLAEIKERARNKV